MSTEISSSSRFLVEAPNKEREGSKECDAYRCTQTVSQISVAIPEDFAMIKFPAGINLMIFLVFEFLRLILRKAR
jgi:hypothetical protein